MNQINKSRSITGWMIVVSLFVSLAACDSSGSSSSGSGGVQTFSRTAVQGNVSSSSFGGSGGLEGIDVAVGDRSTSTDAAGNFRLTGVPAGEQTIVFSKGGEQASMKINVGAGGTLTISNIKVGRNSAGSPRVSSTPSSSSRPADHDDDSDDDSDERKGSSDKDDD